MNTLLNAAFSAFLEEGYEIGLNWIGKFARAIIEGVGNIGVGIILFTLVLKAITLPFDIYQRVTMRKQNLIMREMQPELEKLQKQYANDKATYNQKMVELQKKNGYSILGACLPMIISLVILIVAFSGFSTYSQYANLKTFKEMSEVYNAAIIAESPNGIDYRLSEADGVFTVVWTESGEEKSQAISAPESGKTLKEFGFDTGDIEYKFTENRVFYVSSPDKMMEYEYDPFSSSPVRSYYYNEEKLLAREGAKERLAAIMEENNANDKTEDDCATEEDAYPYYVAEIGSDAAAAFFHGEGSPKFLWVRNVWYPDVAWSKPVPSYDSFSKQLNKKVTFPEELDANGDPVEKDVSSVLTEREYNNYLTRSLSKEKSQANGYFILVILSIGTMVLSQFITMKSSKESNKYQTVDGQGARTQKMMLFIMPLIFAVFAFLYSAAFSIYMTMSNVVSLLVTVFANLILDRIFKKKEEAAYRAEHTRELPWMKNKQENDKKNKKRK